MLKIQLHLHVLESIVLQSKFHCSRSTLCLIFMTIFRLFFNIYKTEWIMMPFDVFGRRPGIYVEFKYILNKLRWLKIYFLSETRHIYRFLFSYLSENLVFLYFSVTVHSEFGTVLQLIRPTVLN